jgi:hypothetical protein
MIAAAMTDTKLTQCCHCQLYFPRNELDGYVEEKDTWARFIENYDGPLWCIFCEYDGDLESVGDATPGVKSPNIQEAAVADTDSIKEEIIQAFKKTISKEMGRTSSSLIARQTLPIAWEVGKTLGYNPYEFARAIGYSDSLLEEKGYPSRNPIRIPK